MYACVKMPVCVSDVCEYACVSVGGECHVCLRTCECVVCLRVNVSVCVHVCEHVGGINVSLVCTYGGGCVCGVRVRVYENVCVGMWCEMLCMCECGCV